MIILILLLILLLLHLSDEGDSPFFKACLMFILVVWLFAIIFIHYLEKP